MCRKCSNYHNYFKAKFQNEINYSLGQEYETKEIDLDLSNWNDIIPLKKKKYNFSTDESRL